MNDPRGPINDDPLAKQLPSDANDVFTESKRSEIVEAVAIQFCTRCGHPLELGSGDCESCAKRPQLNISAAESAQGTSRAIRDTVGLYLVLLLTLLPAAMLAWTGNEDPTAWANTDVALTAVDAIIIAIWAIVRWKGIRPILFAPFKLSWLIAAPLLSLLSFGFAALFIALLKWVFGEIEILATEPFVQAGYSPIAIIVLICVLPAIVEELAFRGIIFNGLVSIVSIRDAIIVSSLMFAVFHLSAFGLPQLLLGLLFACSRVASGSIVPGMIMHFCHNLLCVLSELYWS